MKTALLAVSKGVNDNVNIGDYIQALASRQFVGNTDIFIERETELKSYCSELVKMIMNGWYTNNPQNFPPSELIKPLFVAFNISKQGVPDMLRPECIEYYKKFEPIGCRDMNTMQMLQEKGVDAYFSGCMTLTLGKTYYSDEKEEKYYVVDPYFRKSNIRKHPMIALRFAASFIMNYSTIKSISKKRGGKCIKDYWQDGIFFTAYSKVVSKDILSEAEYINQYNLQIHKDYPSNEDKMMYAEELVKKYAKAKLVVTSRIHCALPCIGLGTPVLFVNNAELGRDRLSGLSDFFNCVEWGFNRINIPDGFKKITKINIPVNKDKWKPFAAALIKRCNDFVDSNE